MEPGTPANKWSPLEPFARLGGAMHALWKDGQRDDAICARVPRTAAVVKALPLSRTCRAARRRSSFPCSGPVRIFRRIPGVSNVRTIIHLR